ncbi:serine hydrolase domain-containing protein [candidate division KSB1 bacterium]
MKRLNLVMVIYSLLVIGVISCSSKNPAEPEPVFNSFQEKVEYLIESNFKTGGVAIGIIKGDEEFTFFHGRKSKNSSSVPDGNSIFELGSITKTFTATILADFVLNGTIELDDEVQDYLPSESVTLPSFNGSNITFMHIATHTSGLPTNFSDNYPRPAGSPPEDPFALMTEEHVYDYLSNYASLISEPGTQYKYSNFGYGFLGLILSKINNTSFEDLLSTKILNVLGMDRTSYTLSEEQLTNVAVGHNSSLEEVEPWGTNHVLIGCGGLKSTLNDMLIYLKANMGIQQTQLSAAMTYAQEVYFDNYICLGWQKRALSDGQVITWFAGASAGHIAFIGFNENYSNGVVVLYNIGQNMLADEVGNKILEAAVKY